ncbi:MAG: single-stranded DNA-binding protein [Oscillatoriaceae bacterium SKW80]|nr:single-stranded DNA-binding protein [Oscillatoriaceae bacterium SKYG93]MCX8119450.1 single-stranded DNA-binding protein [Oscillatoriaceae bacterium SKW80]MDW8454916.1 single-stranded DNA-binding protein [Oscillatoriaceae cyanobacterium SKYGB_i_bin93]HIK28305.1 single-stranded DNA-binding protein [Oscillatoriaceae cyanobacterium M7585_C2015_266]
MNSFIVMAEIVKDPELRYTTDNKKRAEMLIKFPALREEDPPSILKVVGWGNLAEEICDRYREGDQVVIEGRLNMNTVERPEGFKEKRAELTASRIHSLKPEALKSWAPAAKSSPNNVISNSSSNQSDKIQRWSEPPTKYEPANTSTLPPVESETLPPVSEENKIYVINEPSIDDDIPF